jgi:hypothetical protein
MRRPLFFQRVRLVRLLGRIQLRLQTLDTRAQRIELLLLAINDIAEFVISPFEEGDFEFDAFERFVHAAQSSALGIRRSSAGDEVSGIANPCITCA